MKKRTILLPLSLFAIISCSSRPDGDIRNKYSNEGDCQKDNPREEIAKNLDDDDDFDPSHLCEKVISGNDTYYLGPAYPHVYYGHTGFYNGYWIGRMSSYSNGVVHESGQSFTRTQIASNGGIETTVTAAKTASASPSGKTISRGGFGSFGHASVGG